MWGCCSCCQSNEGVSRVNAPTSIQTEPSAGSGSEAAFLFCLLIQHWGFQPTGADRRLHGVARKHLGGIDLESWSWGTPAVEKGAVVGRMQTPKVTHVPRHQGTPRKGPRDTRELEVRLAQAAAPAPRPLRPPLGAGTLPPGPCVPQFPPGGPAGAGGLHRCRRVLGPRLGGVPPRVCLSCLLSSSVCLGKVLQKQ